MYFFSRPACIRKETRPKAAGAYEIRETGQALVSALCDIVFMVSVHVTPREPHLVQNHSKKHDDLHCHLSRGHSCSQSKSISYMQNKNLINGEQGSNSSFARLCRFHRTDG